MKIQPAVLNTRSQAAIAKLGAVREGVVRRDIKREDGTFWDSVVFSVSGTSYLVAVPHTSDTKAMYDLMG